MTQVTRLSTGQMDSEAAIRQIRNGLTAQDLRVVRSFDLKSACASYPDLTCPHHNDGPCDCQLVVLLVYGSAGAKAGAPASLVVHSRRGQTEIDLVDSPDHRPDPGLVDCIRLVLSQGDVFPDPVNELSDAV